MSNSKYVFFITGSIAAFKAAQVISRLVKDGAQVRCVASQSALKFVGAATFEGLTGETVLTDLWQSGRAMDHIHLSRWADCGVVCPASANTIAQMALGLAPDMVSSTLLAWPRNKPLHVFPAMNIAMLNSQTTQQHLRTLSERGILVAPTGAGHLACGETGEGRLLEPDQILNHIGHDSPSRRKVTDTERRVLITGGATREKIDGVRFISNVSTGRTAAALCDYFSDAGWTVTYVHGEQAAQPSHAVHALAFSDVASMDEILREQLGQNDFAAVIQAAAVSDFTVDRINGGARDTDSKISSRDGLLLQLRPTPKLLPRLREYSRNKNVQVIGFKLLHHSTAEQLADAAEKVLRTGADAVVANDWAQLNGDRSKHAGFVKFSHGKREFTGVEQMAQLLNEFLATKDVL